VDAALRVGSRWALCQKIPKSENLSFVKNAYFANATGPDDSFYSPPHISHTRKFANTMTTRVAIYARVSTTNHGQDVSMQTRELRQFAEARGWQIVGEYIDAGVSGAKDSRPELNRLMADAHKRRFDVVCVWRFDRFARSVSHLLRALETFKALGTGTNSQISTYGVGLAAIIGPTSSGYQLQIDGFGASTTTLPNLSEPLPVEVQIGGNGANASVTANDHNCL
jgi:hypothetical protein